MTVDRLDHLVLTVQDVDVSAAWYRDILGMRVVAFGSGRTALHFGSQKLNLHPASGPIVPHAAMPTCGSGDLCFLTTVPLHDVETHLAAHQVPIEEGPVLRTGAMGPLQSLYLRDPNGNLIEIASQQEDRTA